MELLVGLIVAVFILILGTSVGFGCWFTVQQQTISVVQRLGRFNRFAHPGLNFKLPFVESVTAQVSMRTRQLLLKVETKTKDNVFVHVSVAVQFLVMPDKVYASVYSLQDPESQITAFVFNVVRAHVPSLDLDD